MSDPVPDLAAIEAERDRIRDRPPEADRRHDPPAPPAACTTPP